MPVEQQADAAAQHHMYVLGAYEIITACMCMHTQNIPVHYHTDDAAQVRMHVRDLHNRGMPAYAHLNTHTHTSLIACG